jgi:hypothetical protein
MRGLLLSMVVFVGCEAGTGGELVSTRFEVEVAPLDDPRLTLVEGHVSLAPLYANELAAPVVHPLRRVSTWLWPSAWAHGGHDFFSGGQVVSEWLRPTVVSLAPGRTLLGESRSIAGPVRSATLHLVPLSELSEATLTLRGLLHRDGEPSRPWALTLTLPGTFEDRRVDFITADGTLAEGATVVLEVKPSAWFDGARFEEAQLDPLPPDSQTARAVMINLKRAGSWRVRVE